MNRGPRSAPRVWLPRVGEADHRGDDPDDPLNPSPDVVLSRGRRLRPHCSVLLVNRHATASELERNAGCAHVPGLYLHSRLCRENCRDVEPGIGWDRAPEHCDRWTTPLDLAEASRLQTICDPLRLRQTT